MTTYTPRTDAAWKLTRFSSALLEHDGEICDEIHCASHDEAECLGDLLNKLTERAEKAEADVERLLDTLKFIRDECPLGKRTFARVSIAINASHKL